MKILAILRVAARTMRRNKLRTTLTMLGMIIGVAAVIATVSIGNGAKSQVESAIASFGENMVLVFAGSFTRGGAHSGWNNAGTLMPEDALAIEREVPGIRLVSPELRMGAQVTSSDGNWGTNIQGEGQNYLDIRNWALSQGAMFTEQDVRSVAKVAIIGRTVANQLFPEGDALGQVVRINHVPFVVVGVLVAKGLSVMGNDQDDVVIIPYTSCMKRLQGVTNLRAIMVSAASRGALAEVERQIISLLRQRHRITPGHEDDFTVRTQEEFTQMADQASSTLRVLLAAIALVSLIVGGIGIMNIMLVSVTERTREIGIRMAVGAHAKHILLQFLTEAVALSMIGGLVGIAVGMACASIVAAKAGWPVLTPLDWIFYAFAASALVGIFFGFYPAWKASKLDPIEALRYE